MQRAHGVHLLQPDPLTLVVDIPEVDASLLSPRIDVGTPEVESLRVTQMARADGRNLARLEVRLASLVPYQIYSKDRDLYLVFEQTAVARREAAPPEPAQQPVAVPEPPPNRSAIRSQWCLLPRHSLWWP